MVIKPNSTKNPTKNKLSHVKNTASQQADQWSNHEYTATGNHQGKTHQNPTPKDPLAFRHGRHSHQRHS